MAALNSDYSSDVRPRTGEASALPVFARNNGNINLRWEKTRRQNVWRHRFCDDEVIVYLAKVNSSATIDFACRRVKWTECNTDTS